MNVKRYHLTSYFAPNCTEVACDRPLLIAGEMPLSPRIFCVVHCDCNLVLRECILHSSHGGSLDPDWPTVKQKYLHD